MDAIGRLCLAVLAGATIGWERQRADKPAGLRTHMLVALGSAVFVVATLAFTDNSNSDSVKIGASRVVAAIIGGVGFLGAGTILESRGTVHGITTAATIWIAAGVGVASGLGLPVLAFSAVLLSLVTLIFVGVLEERLFKKGDANENDSKHTKR